MPDLASVDWSGLLPFVAIGFAAQMVDGALGMAFGVVCNVLLVAVLGVPPARSSANIHIVEVFTTAAAGISHTLAGNVDLSLFLRLLLPGIVGGLTGAYVLVNLDGDAVKPFILGYLVLIGVYLLVRGILFPPKNQKPKVVEPLGLIGGFLDAVGGGGWGPVATPALLADGRLTPRKVIGTVDTSEFAVSAAASIGFLIGLGAAGINWGFALALLAGGLVAAPLAAYLVRIAPAHLLGVAVGGIILLTNSRTLMRSFDVAGSNRWWVYAAILLVTAVGLYIAAQRSKRQSALTEEQLQAEGTVRTRV